MAKIISLVNQKGGVGKTTTTLNLGAYLAEAGKYVLIVDADPQGNATSGLGIAAENVEAGLYEVLARQKAVQEVIYETPVPNLKIFPSTQALAAANVELVNYENRDRLMKEALLEIRNDYDYILVDCPPSLGILTVNGLVAADSVIIPVQSEYYALEGLGQLLETVHLVQQNLNKELRILGAVVTMHDRRTKLSAQVLKEMNRHFPNNIFEAVIPRNVKLSEAPSHGQTIRQYEPWSKGAKAYRRLAQEVLNLE
ncbi:ParA family protein [Patescibacteria group bacterium]